MRFMVVFGLMVVASTALPAAAIRVATESMTATEAIAAQAVVPGAKSATAAHAVPAPSRQPTSSPSQESGAVVSHLRIPSLGVNEIVRSGIALSVIDRGVAHWVGTAAPGGDGNVVLAGHRTTHTRPFSALDRLEPGDLIYLEDGDGFEVIYRVSDTFIVQPEDIWITYDFGKPMLTMFACHPKGSARQRIVVQADLVAGRRIA
jgi:sortase A